MKRSKIYSRLMINRTCCLAFLRNETDLSSVFFGSNKITNIKLRSLLWKHAQPLYTQNIIFEWTQDFSLQWMIHITHKKTSSLIENIFINTYLTLAIVLSFSHFLPGSEIWIMVKVNRVGERCFFIAVFFASTRRWNAYCKSVTQTIHIMGISIRIPS